MEVISLASFDSDDNGGTDVYNDDEDDDVSHKNMSPRHLFLSHIQRMVTMVMKKKEEEKKKKKNVNDDDHDEDNKDNNDYFQTMVMIVMKT